MSPARSSQNSDKENQGPDSRDTTPRPVSKGKRAMASTNDRLPTPRSGSSSEHGNKRRRTGDYSITDSTQIYQDQDEYSEVRDEEENEENAEEDEEDEETRNYDPHQDPDLRRQVRANIRQHHREIEGESSLYFA
jgi:hypothetical protein